MPFRNRLIPFATALLMTCGALPVVADLSQAPPLAPGGSGPGVPAVPPVPVVPQAADPSAAFLSRLLASGPTGQAGTPIATRADQLCAPSRGLQVGLAWHRLSTEDRRLCQSAGRDALFQPLLGTLVLIPVMGQEPGLSLTVHQLYEAITAEAAPGQPNQRTHWRQIDASLPDLPIRVLLPAPGSAEEIVLERTLLTKGCEHRRSGTAAAPPGASPAGGDCGRLRQDAQVSRADATTRPGDWLATAGPGAIALVGYGQLQADPRLAHFVPLDGMVPTAKARETGDYPTIVPVYFIATHQGAQTLALGDPSVRLANTLLAEATAGPQGQAAQSGVAPTGPDKRVNRRKDFAQFLTTGGVWE